MNAAPGFGSPSTRPDVGMIRPSGKIGTTRPSFSARSDARVAARSCPSRRTGMQPTSRQNGRISQKSKNSLAIRNPSRRSQVAWSTIGSAPQVWLAIRIAGPRTGKGAIPDDSSRCQTAQYITLSHQRSLAGP
jgi:hypothetical protein